MADCYLGEIRTFPFAAIPQGWLVCAGQILQVSDNQALASLLGKTFGGDGKNTYGLPDLRGRVAMATTGLQGTVGGEEAHLLVDAEVPLHTHLVSAKPKTASLPNASGALWGQPFADGHPIDCYGAPPQEPMAPTCLSFVGQTQKHPNMQPYAVLTFAIAVQGNFPPRPGTAPDMA